MLLHRLRARLLDNARRMDRLAARLPRSQDRLSRWVADPALLMADSGYDPDPWQAEFLRSRDLMNLLLCARQVGKSQAVAILVLLEVLTKPGGLTVVVAQRQDQAGELLRKVVTAYDKVGSPVPVKREGATHLELTNGARVLALPGEERAMHGPTAGLLVIDEAARVPDEVFHAASPQLSATKGRLVALSTAFSKSGWFYREWTEGAGYRRWSITATECPRHSPEFLERERRSMGDRWFDMAYRNVFGDDIAAVFRTEDIKAAVNPTLLPLFQRPTAAPARPSAADPTLTPLFRKP